MNSIKLIIKGFFIGLAKIIPGVSGAVLAILFGLYDKAIDAITNFFNDKKGNFYFLLYTGLGVLVAILFGSIGIKDYKKTTVAAVVSDIVAVVLTIIWANIII